MHGTNKSSPSPYVHTVYTDTVLGSYGMQLEFTTCHDDSAANGQNKGCTDVGEQGQYIE